MDKQEEMNVKHEVIKDVLKPIDMDEPGKLEEVATTLNKVEVGLHYIDAVDKSLDIRKARSVVLRAKEALEHDIKAEHDFREEYFNNRGNPSK